MHMNVSLGAHLIFVSDVQASKTFYRDILGLKLVEENPHFTEYTLPGGRLYVEEKNPDRAKGFEGVHIGGPTGVVFAVDDIHAVIDEFRRANVTVLVEPVRQVWGGWNAIITDADGNQFILDEDEF